MSLLVSDRNCVSFKFESGTYASPSGTSGNWLGLVTSHEISESQNVIEVRYACNDSRNVGQFLDGPQDYEGTLTFHPQNFALLGFALGSIVDTSGATTTHTFSENNSSDKYAFTSGTLNPFASITMIDSKRGVNVADHIVRTVNGCVANSFTINFSEGEPVECEYSYIGQSMSVGSTLVNITSGTNLMSHDNTRPYMWTDVRMHLPSGTVIQTLKEGNFTMNNNLESKHYLTGSREISIPVPMNRDYEVSATIDMTSALARSLYDSYWNGGSTFNAMLELVQSASENLYVIMSGCKMTDMSAPSTTEGVNEMSLTFKPQTCIATEKNTILKYSAW